MNDANFSGSIPDIYDEFLVPLIFDNYAADLAKLATGDPVEAVLETASGSGVVTRALAPRLAEGTRYCVTDLNPPMIERAKAQQPDPGRIEWGCADAMSLPFGDAEFDAVVCQFGVMFFPDRAEGIREAMRVLKPGGRFIYNVWDHIGANEFADVVTKAVGETFAEDPPMFLARTPHGYHDRDIIAADLRAADVANFQIETVTHVSTAANARIPAVAYCQGTPLRNEIEARDPSRLAQATDHAEAALDAQFGSGPISGQIRAHVIVARK